MARRHYGNVVLSGSRRARAGQTGQWADAIDSSDEDPC